MKTLQATTIRLRDIKNEFVQDCTNLIHEASQYRNFPEQAIYDSMKKNLNIWADNKQSLCNLLSTHPDWDSDNLCIATIITKERPLNFELTNKLIEAFKWNNRIQLSNFGILIDNISIFLYWCKRSDTTGVFSDDIMNVIKSEVSYFSEMEIKTSSKEFLDLTPENFYNNEFLNVSYKYERIYLLLKYCRVRVGQKISKIIINILKIFGCDFDMTNLIALREEELIQGQKVYLNADKTKYYIDYYYKFNEFCELLSASLNPKLEQEKIYISINPMDYLTQSHAYNDAWSSCHSLHGDGCYHAGIMTMLNDSTSVIVYTLKDNEPNKNYWKYGKLTRQSIFISDNKNAILQNVLYPSKSMESSKAIREVLQSLCANYLQMPCLWTKKEVNSDDIDTSEYLGYCDFAEGKPYSYTTLKNTNESIYLTIGAPAYSINYPNDYIQDLEKLTKYSGDYSSDFDSDYDDILEEIDDDSDYDDILEEIDDDSDYDDILEEIDDDSDENE